MYWIHEPLLQLWKESLKGDGQQWHQYQQKEQWPLTWTHWTQKKIQ